jgi:hypothetical protein
MLAVNYLCRIHTLKCISINVEPSIGGSLKDSIKLTQIMVKEKQWHPFPDIVDKRFILYQQSENTFLEALSLVESLDMKTAPAMMLAVSFLTDSAGLISEDLAQTAVPRNRLSLARVRLLIEKLQNTKH